jgi:hypothetical protein
MQQRMQTPAALSLKEVVTLGSDTVYELTPLPPPAR